MSSALPLTPEEIIIDQALAATSLDFSDVLYYSDPSVCGGFKKVADDSKNSISVYSKPMACSPINMMRASVIMPCSPAEFVRYMEPDARVLWDEHYKYGKLVRRIAPLGAVGNGQKGTTTDKPVPSPPASAPTTGQTTNQQKPPEDYPQLKIFEFNSPVPSLVRNRDFEMVMCQKVNVTDGTALVKGFSTPKGYLLPLRYKKGSEAEGERSGKEALRQRPDRFREALGVDISSLETPSMKKLTQFAAEKMNEKNKPTNLRPPQSVRDDTLPGLVGVPAYDTSSLESTVRGTIVFSGFVAVPIFEDDKATLSELPTATRQLIETAQRNREACGPLPPQSPLFAYPYATTVGGRRIVASRVTYVALIQPQGNVHPMFVNVVVRMQTRGLRSMQRVVAQYPVKTLDEKLIRSKL